MDLSTVPVWSVSGVRAEDARHAPIPHATPRAAPSAKPSIELWNRRAVNVTNPTHEARVGIGFALDQPGLGRPARTQCLMPL